MSQRAVIYARISLDRTGEGAGVERQIEACRGLATARGWEVVGVETDNSISAFKDKKRPGWERVKSLMDSGSVDVVIAYHMDRITRTMAELETVIELGNRTGVGIATATGDIDLTTDTGRMVARILGAVASAEVERKGARQKSANLQRAKAGKPHWRNKPFGLNLDGSHVPTEADAIREAYSALIAGESLASIAKRWNAAGFVTPLGKPWGSWGIRHVLGSARNAAIVVRNGEEVGPGEWEAIVNESTYRAAAAILSRNVSTGGGQVSSLLTGIAVCGNCGGKMKLQWRGKKGAPKSYAIYKCREGFCSSIRADFADGVVTRHVMRRCEEWGAEWLESGADASENADALTTERNELRVRKDALVEDYADGLIERQQFKAATERINARLAEVETELEAAGSGAWLGDIELAWMEWDGWPVDRRRALLLKVAERVEVLPKGKGDHRPRQDQLRVTMRQG